MCPDLDNTPESTASGGEALALAALQALKALGGGLGASGVGAALADPEGTILWANEALLRLAGEAAARGLPGRRLEDLLAETDEPGLLALRPARQRFFQRLEAPLPGWPGPGAGTVLHLLVERTAAVLRERERRQREVYLSRAAEDSMDAILSLDTGGRIRYWNHGAERMFGYAAGEVVGRPYDLLVPDQLKQEGELDRIAEILERQGVLRNFETVRLARGGKPIEVDITVTRLREEMGAVLGRSVIYRDISLRRRLESELRENLVRVEAFRSELSRKVDELRSANLTLRRNQEKLIALEKLSAIGEIAAKVAHEIRTPLVTIGGFSHTLWKSTPEDSPQRRYLEIIREEVRRLERIVSDILDYVRPGTIETEPCDAGEIVEEALRAHLDELSSAGIGLERRLAPALPPVQVNRDQMRQVLTNLIVNAIQAVGAAAPGSRRIVIATELGENHVRISISDSGAGIPERHRARIFRPFFTTKPGGSGLGLAISAQIVAQHQATLTFDSEEGRGTTFHLRLPTSREAQAGEDDPRGG